MNIMCANHIYQSVFEEMSSQMRNEQYFILHTFNDL